MNIDRVVAHEYFHNWTGNRVTCRDWFQLSLKEGLTVFRDQEFGADMYSRAGDSASRRCAACAPRSSPRTPARWRIRCGPQSYIEINNFYTATVYEKGAEVVRMIHTLIGARALPQGHGPLLRAPRRPGGDLRRLRAGDGRTPAGVDLAQFRRWYDQAGTPRARGDAATTTRRAKRYTLTREAVAARRRRASRRSCRSTSRSRVGLVGAGRQRAAAAARGRGGGRAAPTACCR